MTNFALGKIDGRPGLRTRRRGLHIHEPYSSTDMELEMMEMVLKASSILSAGTAGSRIAARGIVVSVENV